MSVIALDLSLTATGCCSIGVDGAPHAETVIPPSGMTGMERLNWLHTVIKALIDTAPRDAVVFEGLSYGSNDPSAQERAGLAYLLRMDLYRDRERQRKQPYILVPPTSLKKFVTGKGNAEKSLVLKEVYKRWGIDAANDNEADAVGLLYIGLALAGQWEPTTDAQREVLEALRNPKVKPRKGKRTALAGIGRGA